MMNCILVIRQFELVRWYTNGEFERIFTFQVTQQLYGDIKEIKENSNEVNLPPFR